MRSELNKTKVKLEVRETEKSNIVRKKVVSNAVHICKCDNFKQSTFYNFKRQTFLKTSNGFALE